MSRLLLPLSYGPSYQLWRVQFNPLSYRANDMRTICYNFSPRRKTAFCRGDLIIRPELDPHSISNTPPPARCVGESYFKRSA